jgi:hypothetical protein
MGGYYMLVNTVAPHEIRLKIQLLHAVQYYLTAPSMPFTYLSVPGVTFKFAHHVIDRQSARNHDPRT